MAINTKLAKKVLTKAQQRHLTDVGVNTRSALVRTRRQHLYRVACGDDEPCHTCRAIAIKLGLEE